MKQSETMTTDELIEFLEAEVKAGRAAFQCVQGCIRTDLFKCPLIKACLLKTKRDLDVASAGRTIGCNDTTICDVITASDSSLNTPLRQKLMHLVALSQGDDK